MLYSRLQGFRRVLLYCYLSCSSSGGTALTCKTPGATLAATCSPAVCAQPSQQNSIQRPHPPVLGTTSLQLPARPIQSFPGCTTDSLTGQQEAAAHLELEPTGLRASASAPCRAAINNLLATSATATQQRCSAIQLSGAAESAADLMAPKVDAKLAKTNQKRSALALEVMLYGSQLL